MAAATMDTFAPDDIVDKSLRTVGLMLAAVGYYGPQASEDGQSQAADYATDLADAVEANLERTVW